MASEISKRGWDSFKMNPRKLNIGRILTLVGLSILCVLLLWAAYGQITFFVRIVTNETLGWRAAAGVFFRFILVLILALGAGVGPCVFIYRRICPKKKNHQ